MLDQFLGTKPDLQLYNRILTWIKIQFRTRVSAKLWISRKSPIWSIEPYFASNILVQCEGQPVSKTKPYPFEKKSIRVRFDFIWEETQNEVRIMKFLHSILS